MATDATARLAALRGIYVIVNDPGPDPLAVATGAIAAGVRVLQYRAKDGIDPDRLSALRVLTKRSGALLIVNDDWRAAFVFDCDGVHLGPGDDGFADVTIVREALGTRLIGMSCGSVDEALAATAAQADYIGVGSVYATASKVDAGEPIGIDGLLRIATATTLPVAAIGGIDASNIAEVARTGIAMAAVISAVGGSADPAAAAQELVRLWGAR